MKNIKLLIIVGLSTIILSLTGCNELIVVNGSEKMEEKEFDLSNFEHLAINNLMEATIIQSDEFKIIVKTNENVIDYLELNVEENTLNLKMESGIFYKGVICQATVYMPKLNKVELSGIATLNIEEFTTEEISLDLYGNTKIKGDINVEKLFVQSSGNARLSTGNIKIELKGKADYANIKMSGESELLGGNLIVKSVEVDSKGPSKMTLTVIDGISGELEGASQVKYYGNPIIENVYTSGFAEITKVK